MKRATQCSLFLAVLGGAAIIARADAVGDYKVILDRNPFGLKPPPAPLPPPTNAPPTEAPTSYKANKSIFKSRGLPETLQLNDCEA